MTLEEEIATLEAQLRLFELEVPCNCTACRMYLAKECGNADAGYLKRLRERLRDHMGWSTGPSDHHILPG